MKYENNRSSAGLLAAGLALAEVLAVAGPASDRESAPAGRLIGKPGQKIDPARHAVRGKVTIVDFYSAGCGACRRIAPHLEQLARARPDIAVLTVDVNRPGVRGIDFRSPVVRQHGIESLPHFQIYDRDGHMRVEGEEAHRLVAAWITALAPGEVEPPANAGRRPADTESDRAGSSRGVRDTLAARTMRRNE